MKKIMLMAALMVATISASAQVYLGGGVSFHSTDLGKTKTTVSILPEIGYKLDDQISFGIALGYAHSKYDEDKADAFSFEPYFRYTFARWNNVSFFGEIGFGYEHQKGGVFSDDNIGSYTLSNDTKVNTWYIGVRPGVTIDITNHLSLVTKIGWLGYKSMKPDYDGAETLSDFGLDIDGSNIIFGMYYNF